MSIEKKAVNKVEDIFEDCAYLDSQITVNDRGRFTDGYIDVFNTDNDPHARKDFAGRVDVQVKGKTVKKFGGTLSFSVERVALEGFLKIQGVLYFVVALDEDRRKKAYYLDLSPHEIMRILNGMKPDAKSKTLHFKRLPTTPKNLTDVVRLALTRQREDPLVTFGSIDLEKINGFTIHALGDLDFTKPLVLDRDEIDFALELNTASGGGVLIDANIMFTPHDYLSKKVSTAVATGEWSVDHYNWRRLSETEAEAVITPGIRMTSNRAGEHVSLSVTFTPQDNLGQRHFDLGFVTNLMDTGELRFGDDGDVFEFQKPVEFDGLRHEFEIMDKLVDLFNQLEIDASLISLESITDKQWHQLEDIYAAVVEGEEIRQEIATADRRILQPIGPWYIEMFVLPGKEEGFWNLHGVTDLLTASWALRSAGAGKEQLFYVVTPYEVIGNERLARTLNLRPSAIEEHYEAIRDLVHCSEMATGRVLDFLRAADSCEPRRREFLLLAQRLNEWLIAKDGEQPHLLINRWQIIARRSPLTPEKRAEVRSIRRQLGSDRSDMHLAVGCAILLGDEEEVSDLEQEMSSEEMEQMRSWPIWTLWARRSTRSESLLEHPAVRGNAV